MTARQMLRLLDRDALIETPDGLVPGVVRDVRVQSGRAVVSVERQVYRRGPPANLLVRETRDVDAARVLVESGAGGGTCWEWAADILRANDDNPETDVFPRPRGADA